MAQRSRAREVVVQLLFQHDLQLRSGKGISEEIIEEIVQDRLNRDDLRELCRELYRGVMANLNTLDKEITNAAVNWRLERMAAVDRNALRLGTYEMLHTETPPKVALDETIELVRRYGSEKSPSFVNGVLDRIMKNNQESLSPSKPDE